MKMIISLMLFVLSFSLFAQDKKGLESTKMEATHYLKQELVRELKQSIALDEFTLSVELDVDQKKLFKTLGISEMDWNKLQDMQLPGLFVEGQDGSSLSATKNVTKEDILMSLKQVKLSITYYQGNYSQEFLVASLKKLTTLNVANLKEAQISVTATLESAPYRAPRTEDVISKVLSKPLDINMMAGPFQSFWDKNYKSIFIAVGILVVALGGFLAYSLKGGLGSLADVIKSKTFTSTSSASTPAAFRPTNVDRGPHGDYQTDHFESYLQANEYLATMTIKDAKVFNEVIMLKLMVEDYTSLIVLLDVLSKEKRENFTQNIDKSKKERFKEFIVTQGPAVLKDEALLKTEAIKMIKLVKVAALAPEELYEIVANDFVSNLNPKELSKLLKVADTNEKQFISEMLGSEQLAYLLQYDAINPEDLDAVGEKLSNSEIVDLLIK